MHPILFTFSFNNSAWPLGAYSLFLFLAGLFSIGGGFYAAKKNNLDLLKTSVLLSLLLATTFIGARLLHGLTNFEYYHQHPQRWLSIDAQGFALFGGIIFAIIAGALSAKLLKINLWKMGDGMAPFLGLSLALVRIGCFLNGCCFGKETKIFLGTAFPFFSPAHKYQLSKGIADIFSVTPVHPTQLYELAAALVGAALAFYCIKKKMPAGTAIISFGIWFAFFRLVNYFLRVQPETFSAPTYFYPSLYLILIMLSFVLLAFRLRKNCK